MGKLIAVFFIGVIRGHNHHRAFLDGFGNKIFPIYGGPGNGHKYELGMNVFRRGAEALKIRFKHLGTARPNVNGMKRLKVMNKLIELHEKPPLLYS